MMLPTERARMAFWLSTPLCLEVRTCGRPCLLELARESLALALSHRDVLARGGLLDESGRHRQVEPVPALYRRQKHPKNKWCYNDPVQVQQERAGGAAGVGVWGGRLSASPVSRIAVSLANSRPFRPNVTWGSSHW